jgi:hypothetical protein
MDIDLDSNADSEGEELIEEEDDDPFSNAPPKEENNQHSNPNSYAWCLMRYAAIKLAQGILEKFLAMAGVDTAGKINYLKVVFSSLLGKKSSALICRKYYNIL